MNDETAPVKDRLKKLRQILTWICIALVVATLLGYAGRFWWLFDLFSHFRLQLSVVCLVVAIVLLFTGTRISAGIALLCCVVNFASLIPVFDFVGSRPSIATESETLRVLLSNVKQKTGIPEKVIAVIKKYDPDIVVLEEISMDWLTALQSLNASYPHVIVEPREDNFGIAVYSRLQVSDRQVIEIGKAGVPSIWAKLRLNDDQTFHLLATHPLPPIGGQLSEFRNEQLARLGDVAATLRPVIVVGDLNTTPWNYHFQKLKRKTKLVDSSVGFGYQPTWPSGNALLRIPLDHVLHSKEIITVRRQIGPNVGSDHFPVIVDLAIISPDDDSQK